MIRQARCGGPIHGDSVHIRRLPPPWRRFGGLPLIFWVDWHRGLAFVLASARRGARYLYSIIVFKPGDKFCPEGQNPDSPDWHELRPYTLDLPNANALKGPAKPDLPLVPRTESYDTRFDLTVAQQTEHI